MSCSNRVKLGNATPFVCVCVVYVEMKPVAKDKVTDDDVTHRINARWMKWSVMSIMRQ